MLITFHNAPIRLRVLTTRRTGIRVSSAILSMASPVFKSLLSPRFKEGTQLQSGSVEIPLPDDDSDSLIIIGHILHFQIDKVPFKLSTQDLLQVARVADKYDLANVLKPMAHCWIPPLLPEMPSTFVLSNVPWDSARRQDLLLAAYSFGHVEIFENIGRDIVLQNDGTEMAKEKLEYVPDELAELFRKWSSVTISLDVCAHSPLGMLNDQGQNTFKSITSAVETTVESELGMDRHFRKCTDQCPALGNRLRFVIKQLHAVQLWPISKLQGKPLMGLFDSIQIISMKDDAFNSELKDLHGSCTGNSTPLFLHEKILKSRKDEIKRALRYPCFQCVREGKGLSLGCSHVKRTASEESPSKRRKLG